MRRTLFVLTLLLIGASVEARRKTIKISAPELVECGKNHLCIVSNSSGHSSASSTSPKSGPGGPYHLTYQNGTVGGVSPAPVVSNIKVFVLFWGGQHVDFHDATISMYQGVVDSTYLDWLNEYNTPSGQTIGRGSFLGHFDYNGANGTVQDADIQTVFLGLIANGQLPGLPAANAIDYANTVIAIHFAPGIKVVGGDGSRSCSQSGGFCGYHSFATDASGNNVIYSIMPDQGGECDGVCGASPTRFQNMCGVATHEIGEIITDPLPNGAWFDSTNNDEIADICNDLYANAGTDVADVVTPTGTFTVQKLWSNLVGDCTVSGAATAPPPHKTTPPPGAPTPAPSPGVRFPAFLQNLHLPASGSSTAVLPHRADVLPHLGPARLAQIHCNLFPSGPCPMTSGFVNIANTNSFKFPSSSPKIATEVFTSPARGNYTIHFPNPPHASVWMYLLSWPDANQPYVFEYGPKRFKPKTISGSINDNSFSQLMKYASGGVANIRWHNNDPALDGLFIQWTLAYVVTKQ